MLLSLRLGKVPALQAAAQNRSPLSSGHRGEGVAALQRLLRDLGHDLSASFRTGKADGIFGSETKRKVEAFQRASSLKADGVVGRLTLAKLDGLILANNVLEEHTPAEVAAREAKNRVVPLRHKTRAAT